MAKINPIQVDFSEFVFDKRLSIFMVDVYNASGSNAIDKVYYEAAGGETKVVESFSSPENNIYIVLEWEGISTLWDGKVKINGQLITPNTPGATFEELKPARRFRLTYLMEINGLSEITFGLYDLNNKTQVTNSVPITQYQAPEINDFRFLYGVLHDGETNTIGNYPVNTIQEVNSSEIFVPVDYQQAFLKQGDFVKVSLTFTEPVSEIIIHDIFRAFSDDGTIEFTGLNTTAFETYLEVKTGSNINEVYIEAEGKSVANGLWSLRYSTMSGDLNTDMLNFININNDEPSRASSLSISKAALNINDSATISYTLSPNTKWNIEDVILYNGNGIFSLSYQHANFNAAHDIKLMATGIYNLAYSFKMPIINVLNGKPSTIETLIPIASKAPTISWNTISLRSSQAGERYTISGVADQKLDTSNIFTLDIIEEPNGLDIVNIRYLNDSTVSFDVIVYDTTVRGNFKFNILNIVNLSGIVTSSLNVNYTVRGFVERIISGMVGVNTLYLGVNILDEVGFNAVLENNGAEMNYKPWNNGNVLSTDAMTKSVGLPASDLYAYTYNPNTKQIILSNYIMNYLLNNQPIVRISKT